jgi:beta-lactam-binding protein with PASTA domain
MNFLKNIAIHTVLIILTLVIVFTTAAFILKGITRHGEALSVPDLTGISTDDAIEILRDKNLKFLVTDSLYFDDKPKLSILDQNPAPNSKVKEGRVIYLTINSDRPPGVAMPNLIDVSLRQAEAMLKAAGLKIGTISYKPDLAQNVVLEQVWKGNSIPPDSKVPKGSSIDLVLGDGLIDAVDVEVPDLSGFTKEQAHNLLNTATLNLGATVYQGKITDSSNAVVIKQVPAAGSTGKSGQPVDIYLKQE